MGNSNMHEAKRNRNDEFYTLYEDIENELQYYTTYLKNKVIFCNADNYKHSNFVKFFKNNFHKLKLKKLHVLDLQGNHYIYTGGDSKLNKVENGDFRATYSINILKESDVVVTNPPFSLFREFIDIMFKYKKNFIVIGNYNVVTYKNIFPLIKTNKLILGYNTPNSFIEPNGNIRHVYTIWYTSFQVNNYKPFLKLSKEYTSENYPKYDNYNAINVNKIKDIPKNYFGVMGVPITYLAKHNPKQFEIIGLGNTRHNFTPDKIYKNPKKITKKREVISGSALNNVLALVTNEEPVGKVYYIGDENEFIVTPYARVLIRNKKPEI